MQRELSQPRYIFADILIALAQADGDIDPRERDLLDAIFADMQLDPTIVNEMWMTPRTLDVVEAILADVSDPGFKNCLLKDCYLLAQADETVSPEENRFLKRIAAVMEVDAATRDAIKNWVSTAIEQKALADKLFGPSPLHG